MQNLTGKKIYGFKFENEKYEGLCYFPEMDQFIGEIGEVIRHDYNNGYDEVVVSWGNGWGKTWYYPASLAKNYVVEEEQQGETTDLTGKQIFGFLFENEDFPLIGFANDMYQYVGEIGTIKEYYQDDDSYSVQFEDGKVFNYPAKLIKKYIYLPKKKDMGENKIKRITIIDFE